MTALLRRRVSAGLLVCVSVLPGAQSPAAAAQSAIAHARSGPVLLDSFDNIARWRSVPSDGVSLAIHSATGRTGHAMRLDFDFHGRAGYAVAHRALPIDLPANYELSFWIRGKAPSNNVEFKLLDASGDNVWWVDRRDYVFPQRWTRFTIKKRQISFAWGPMGGGDLRHAAAVEIAITAGSGGRGSVWIDDLTLTPLDPVPAHPPAIYVTASSAASGAAPALAVDGDARTAWHSADASGPTTLTLDLGAEREFGGLIVDWDTLDFARDYDVQTSDDGRAWNSAYRLRGGKGGRDYLYLPETESHWLRLVLLQSSRGRGYAVREVVVKPLAWSASMNAFDFAVAKDAVRGTYPRAFTDSAQTYWTVIGAPAAAREALVGEDGAVEAGKGMFSLEPFLFANSHLMSWADVSVSQTLDRGDLPIPSVKWATRGARPLTLTTTAWVAGLADSALLLTRYRVTNTASAAQHATLFVTLRPFQVNGPFQFLNGAGGAASLRTLSYHGGRVLVNGGQGHGGETVVPVTVPSGFGATTFDAGGVVGVLRTGSTPRSTTATDSLGRAEGVLRYALEVPPHGSRDVVVAVPFGRRSPPIETSATTAARYAGAELARTRAEWARRVDGVTLRLPAAAQRIARTLRTTQAYILINQDGPAIQPGSRSYERSWIRDGALTSEALLRTGHADRVRAFLEWYAPFQYPSGKIPCCVDHRGADPVPEHDSDGEFIYLVREYYRYTHDGGVLARMWPRVSKAVDYLDSLRQTDRSVAYSTGDNREFYGVLPPSISHEGYSAKAMHSYWDDFWALRGFRDAASLAAVLGKRDDAQRMARIATEFNADLLASIATSMRVHHIDFIPGSADLGDFDATSTTIALDPAGEESALPHPAVTATFDRYWREHEARVNGATTWDAYTPYELRTVGSFIRLGQPERAHALLDYFFDGQRPAAWNEWAEVVRRDPRAPGFIGDMPHTWVGSDFIRSVLDIFAYERYADSSLVIGAGIPSSWTRDSSGVGISGLRTPFGILAMSLRSTGDVTRVNIESGISVPPGGLVVHAPFPVRPSRATMNNEPATLQPDGTVMVRRLPAQIEFFGNQSRNR